MNTLRTAKLISVVMLFICITFAYSQQKTAVTDFPYEKAKQIAIADVVKDVITKEIAKTLTDTPKATVIGYYEETTGKVTMYLELEYSTQVAHIRDTWVAKQQRDFILLQSETGSKWLMIRKGPVKFEVVE